MDITDFNTAKAIQVQLDAVKRAIDDVQAIIDAPEAMTMTFSNTVGATYTISDDAMVRLLADLAMAELVKQRDDLEADFTAI